MGFLYVLRDFLCNKPLLNQEKDVSNNAVLKFLTKAVPLTVLVMSLVLMQSMVEMFTLY